ncbi:unnamed protein product [Dovyalis caffra]|uniref:Uncharacterized protein n=1 Tax=Dovyalis caffra TaxID=77055 RepID=A0AAV1RW76_9ROSI|nr:unnamed protein product [Dovyalis caffra]
MPFTIFWARVRGRRCGFSHNGPIERPARDDGVAPASTRSLSWALVQSRGVDSPAIAPSKGWLGMVTFFPLATWDGVCSERLHDIVLFRRHL